MAINNTRVASRTQDLVAIIDEESGQQVFTDARPLKATPVSEIKYMQNPIETGASITDHFIVLPDGVQVDFLVSNFLYRSVYQQMKALAKAGTGFIVQTKSDTFINMRIEQLPAEEDPERFDAITISLTFVEIQFDPVRIQTLPQSQVASPADSSTVERGEQSGTETQGSVAFRAAQSVGAVN